MLKERKTPLNVKNRSKIRKFKKKSDLNKVQKELTLK